MYREFGECCGEGKAPHIGPYLPIKIVCGPLKGWGGDGLLIEL